MKDVGANDLGTTKEDKMAIREFDAHETKKVPTPVKFTTKEGEKVRFTAAKPTRVRKRVRFKT
jgi:hypothetical protein